MGDILRVNNNLVSWSSYILGLNGLRYSGLTEISYGDKLEVTPGYGMSRSHSPIGRTSGKYVVEPLKMKVFQHVAKEIRDDLIRISPDRTLSTPQIPITLQYYEYGLEAHMVYFEGARFVSETDSISESADAPMVDIEWSILKIWRDGVTLCRPDNIF